MKISIEFNKSKKCNGCKHKNNCTPIKFQFNFSTCEIDCYWKREYFRDNGKKLYKHWYKNGQLHRDDGPAYIYYYENSTTKQDLAWYKNGKLIK